MLFDPRRMWKGASVAVVGGGPSLTLRQVQAVRNAGFRTIGVNDAYLFGVAIDVCFWGDMRWYFGHSETGHPGHRERVLKWPGLRVSCSMSCIDEPGVFTMVRYDGPGLTLPPHLRWYANSGLSAIGLATVMGASRIVLLGFDGQRVNGKMNWHDDNVSQPEDSVFKLHRESARQCAADLEQWPGGSPIVWNCTPDSAYDAFPSCSLEEQL